MCFYVLVAHLDRVRPSEGRGSAFESHRGRQSIKKKANDLPFFNLYSS